MADPGEPYYRDRPWTPPVSPREEDCQHFCKRCGVEFWDNARGTKWCKGCKPVVVARQMQRANDKIKARRLARKAWKV